MEMRKLGNTDLRTAPVVLGGNVFGWTIDEKQSFAVLDEFTALGFNAVDTADVYSRWAHGNEGGESETIIGKWMKARGNRDKVLLITKVGYDMGEGKNISREYMLNQADNSLRRLQTDYIDLYFTHLDDDETPVEETLRAHEELIKAGKVRWIGASNLSPERLRASLEASEAKGLPRYEVFQPEYNLYERQGFEEGVGPICKKHGLGVIAYFALASGFLTGKYRSEDDLGKSARGRGVKKYLNDRGMRILKALDETAEKHKTTHAAVSLAWLMAKPPVTAPIASATNVGHLKSFTAAAALKLSGEDMAKLDEASAY
ncbi:MAG TPA: aldo/keto reductase [Thermodesulfobacteriota bacterium]|nr:aldo/keto reductase [Thermodesulfobacteriota bacterium]